MLPPLGRFSRSSAHRLVLLLVSSCCLAVFFGNPCRAQTLVYEGKDGPGKGKHIVLLAAEWEYRSEDCLPMLARILSERFGYRCTVCFPINAEGKIDPNIDDHLPGLETLETADLLVTMMMMLQLPDEQMQHIVNYVDSGKPVIGLRCSVLAFKAERNPNSKFAHYQAFSTQWPGGFGGQVLGETWKAHYGVHKEESTRSIVDGPNRDHPILKGVQQIWGPTDLYQVDHLPADAAVLMRGIVMQNMNRDAQPNYQKATMPTAWIRQTPLANGDTRRVLTCTMGCAEDFQEEQLRRLIINGCLWATGLEAHIADQTDVSMIGDFKVLPFGRDLFQAGLTPEQKR